MLLIIKQYFFINAIHPAFVISDQWNGSDLSGVSITGTSVIGNLIWYQSVHITVVQSESLFTCDKRHCPKSSVLNGTNSKKKSNLCLSKPENWWKLFWCHSVLTIDLKTVRLIFIKKTLTLSLQSLRSSTWKRGKLRAKSKLKRTPAKFKQLEIQRRET